ncbi:MAG: AraC-like DNA-binding protein [Shewanella sp.]|jgi:AraC-like DNA-binding protein
MANLISVHRFKSSEPQALRNVPIFIPSIILVQTGHKLLNWQADTLRFDKGKWLFAHADQSLTFINQPSNIPFRSIQICFLSAPEPHILESMTDVAVYQAKSPEVPENAKLGFALTQLLAMQALQFNQQTQQQYLNAFYQVLLEVGVLHLLFPVSVTSMRARVSCFFSSNPAKAHLIDDVCAHFALSKSTLTRRLAKEGTTYRDLLSEVRMLHGLSLMQTRHYKQLELALACGYQSESRFGQRFFKQFGLTPKQYMKTV